MRSRCDDAGAWCALTEQGEACLPGWGSIPFLTLSWSQSFIANMSGCMHMHSLLLDTPVCLPALHGIRPPSAAAAADIHYLNKGAEMFSREGS
jgi:hypothetical protein